MATDHSNGGYARQARRWALGLLALASLAACGAAEPGAGTPGPGPAQITTGAIQPATAMPPSAIPPTARPAGPPTIASAPTAQVARPTFGPRPSPIPRPPPSLEPTADRSIASPTALPAAAGAWQTYSDAQAGYHIAYPPDWTASQLLDEAGASITAFLPADAGPGVTVAVQLGGPPGIEPPEHATRRCERVVVAGLTGTRCFDTATSTTSTTLIGKGKIYIIATTDKGLDDGLYQRMLDSFTPVG
jgi:hypothetical protein